MYSALPKTFRRFATPAEFTRPPLTARNWASTRAVRLIEATQRFNAASAMRRWSQFGIGHRTGQTKVAGSHRIESTDMLAGNFVEVFGEPAQGPPTARFRITCMGRL